MRVLGARGGELEQGLAFGVVRQLFEAAVSEPLLEGAAAAAREVFEGPASGVAGEDASFAILHALYRLTINLAEHGAAAARGRRPAVVRRALAALAVLPRPPARRAARDACCAASARSSATPTRT